MKNYILLKKWRLKNYIAIIRRNYKQLKEELKEQKRRIKINKEISKLPFVPEINDKFSDYKMQLKTLNHYQKLEKRERHLNNLKNLHGKYINRTKLIKSVNKELYGYYGISALDK